jgi:hypothetical protein
VGFYPFGPSNNAVTSYLVQPTGVLASDMANIAAAMANGWILGYGTFAVSNILIPSLQKLQGSGNGTILKIAAGTTGYGIAWQNPATTKQATLADLALDCNQVCAGIDLDNTGFTPDSPFVPFDPLHNVRNVFVLASNGRAWNLDNNARGLSVINAKQYFSLGDGFYLGPGAGADGAGCTDSTFIGVTSGPAAGHNFNVQSGSGNNMMVATKGFYAGFNEATGEWGTTQNAFEMAGDYNAMAACQGQQAALHGLHLNGCMQTAVVGSDFDTNSAGNGVTDGVGIFLDSAAPVAVIGNVGTNNSGISPPGGQAFGVQVDGDLTGSTIYGNTVTGNDGDFNYVGGFGSQTISAEVVGLNAVSLFQSPAQNLYEDNVQALANNGTIANSAAETGANYALYPVSSAANLTGLVLQVPDNGDGTQITVVNTTDFTLTFAAAATSHVADGVADVIPALASRTFTYYGALSLWYRSG